MRTIEPPAPTPESVFRRVEHDKTEKALKSLNKLTGLAFDATLELRTSMAAQLEELAETSAEAKLRLAHEKRISTLSVARAERAAKRKEAKRAGRLRKLVWLAAGRQLHELTYSERAVWEGIEEQLFAMPVRRFAPGPTLNDAAALNHSVNPAKGRSARIAQAEAFMALPRSLQEGLFRALTLHPVLWANQRPADRA